MHMTSSLESLSRPDTNQEIANVRGSLQQFLYRNDFQKAYGCSRAHYHMFGDSWPVSFLSNYSHAASQQHIEEETPEEILREGIYEGYRLQLADWIVPYSAAKTKIGYEFDIGHKSNDIGWNTNDDLCRGFMIFLGGMYKDVTVLQMDPNKNRGFFDHDRDPNKRQFFFTMLNLLIYDGYNMGPADLRDGGVVGHKMVAVTNETFAIEKIAWTYQKPYKPNPDYNPLVPSHVLPLDIEFDVIY
jgi:hypothetical protein